MQTAQLPEIGKIYTSKKFKGFTIEPHKIEHDQSRYYIHATDKSGGASNPVLIWQEEWEKSQFVPV